MDMKCVIRLGLDLSHLREHKFKHSFQDTLNPRRNYGIDVESCSHFFSSVPFFLTKDAPS